MKPIEVSLFGATGLIGELILEILVNDVYFNKINVLTRNSFPSNNKKVHLHIIDFSDTKMISKIIQKSSLVFASIGTTQKKVKGDKEAYRKIDYDIITNIAESCKINNIENFLFVSSSGADAKSKNFYLNLKGEIENYVLNLNLSSTSIFRPSLLLGKRNEVRFGEKIAQLIMPLFSYIMPSNLKPIKASAVAKSMVNISKKSCPGSKIYNYDEIVKSQ
jgi:uncharacterized protein YbjT (DUF2867 family)|tara:strand:- start:943 stop:1599 length:657 start_codon:yes stop_codon:yes gene_type:complete